MEFDSIIQCKSLHELESYSASGKVMVRICGVMALGIQDGNRFRKYFIRNMMVTNDKVYSFFFGIGYFLYGFYSTI